MKKLIAFLLAAMMLATLVACGGSDAGAGTGEDTYVLKVHTSAAATDPITMGAQKFADTLKDLTAGKVTCEIYPSSSLGVTADCLEGLPLRACDVVCDSISNAGSICNICNIEAAPYMYNSVEHFEAVWNGEVGDTIRKDIAANSSLTVLGGGLQGIRVMTSNVPVTSVDDVKGLKIRVPTIQMYLDTWKYLGAATTPLAGNEIFTALQQNTVEAQENAYTTNVALSLHEVCKYTVETNHVYSMCAFIMDTNFLKSLPAEYQSAIEEATKVGSAYMTEQYLALADTAKQTCIDNGMEILTVDAEEFRSALAPMISEKYPDLVKYYDMIVNADPNKA